MKLRSRKHAKAHDSTVVCHCAVVRRLIVVIYCLPHGLVRARTLSHGSDRVRSTV